MSDSLNKLRSQQFQDRDTAHKLACDKLVCDELPHQQREAMIASLLNQTPDLWRAGSKPANRPASSHHQSVSRPGTGDLFAASDMIQEGPGTHRLTSQVQAGNQARPNAQTLSSAQTRLEGKAQSTGFDALDRLLPQGGWPERGLVEMICPHQGIGELQLLMPLLRERSQRKQSILWIAPPYPLHAPALKQAGINLSNSFVIPPQTQCNQALWSIEKALQSSECGLVLAWQNWLSARVIRRLQLAASEGNTLGILFHQRATLHSPATLQLQLGSAVSDLHASPESRAQRNLNVSLLKARGSYHKGQASLRLPC